MSCSSCCICFKQADGTVVKRSEIDGAFVYFLPNGSRTTTAPANFANDNPVDCSLYENQVAPADHEMQIFCVEDANGDATGVRVMTISHVDPVTKEPSIKRYNMADMSEWTGDPATLANCGTDDQLESDPVFMCDGGTTFIRWVLKEKGQPTGDTYDTTLAGAAYTASGNEVPHACNEQVVYDYESACFRDPSDIDNLKVAGSIKRSTNLVTGAVTIEYLDDAGNVLDMNAYKKVPCC